MHDPTISLMETLSAHGVGQTLLRLPNIPEPLCLRRRESDGKTVGRVLSMSGFAIFPGVRFIPTGGIGAANLGAYLAEPNVIACGGSWLDDGATGEALAENARAAAAVVSGARARNAR
jgi:hypothetical protein